jgi:hypothetical protein
MTWVTRQYSKGQIDDAGDVLISPQSTYDEREEALVIINNWRACHNFPLNTFKMGLLGKTEKVDSKGLVAQRIKRLSSIKLKLERFPGMKLSRMQDIAGCRAIVSSVANVDALAALYKTKKGIKHELHREDDYIRNPKASGYRGVHLVYRYFSDRKETYNGLSVEVQLRSQIQHNWATAVETAGMFVQQALKSSQGEEAWLRFFSLMGSALAIREKSPTVPDTPAMITTLRKELRRFAKQIDVVNRLTAYGQALKIAERPGQKKSRYFVVEVDYVAKQLKIRGYLPEQLQLATDDYAQTERRISATNDAVLVSVDSINALRRAYPNYYLDTHAFIQLVREATK